MTRRITSQLPYFLKLSKKTCAAIIIYLYARRTVYPKISWASIRKKCLSPGTVV